MGDWTSCYFRSIRRKRRYLSLDSEHTDDGWGKGVIENLKSAAAWIVLVVAIVLLGVGLGLVVGWKIAESLSKE